MNSKKETMKNFTILILLALVPILITPKEAKTQNTNYFNGAYELTNLLQNAKPYAKPENAEVKFTMVKKGKVKTTVYKFNENGMLTELLRSNKKNVIETIAKINYDDQKQIIGSIFNDKKNKYDEYKFTYDTNGKLTELRKTNEDGELKFKKNLTFNSDGDLKEQTFSHKKNGEISSKYIYEYYEKGKIAHTYYYKKGKLKREWDYMCKEEGEEITKKDFYKVCKFHETKNDTLTMIYQSVDHKGKTTKTVYRFTAKDTLPLAQSNYNSKNELTIKFTYDKSYDKFTSSIYYKNGKPNSEYYITYSENKIVSQSHLYKNKITYKTEYKYDSNGNVTELLSYGKKGNLKGKTTVEYTFR